MWPDRVSTPGPLTLESDALVTALRGPAPCSMTLVYFTAFGVTYTVKLCTRCFKSNETALKHGNKQA